MTTERLVRMFAGTFVLGSLLLAWVMNDVRLFDGPTWLWFTAFVGANLLQSGFTRWCLLESILRKLHIPSVGHPAATGP
jgi:Inner membrane protein YgaP-like, transmembrane domain